MFTLTRDILKERLEKEAGLEPLNDRYHVGYIAAVNDLLHIRVEDLEE
jgi:hypothetical protein